MKGGGGKVGGGFWFDSLSHNLLFGHFESAAQRMLIWSCLYFCQNGTKVNDILSLFNFHLKLIEKLYHYVFFTIKFSCDSYKMDVSFCYFYNRGKSPLAFIRKIPWFGVGSGEDEPLIYLMVTGRNITHSMKFAI